MPEQYIPKIVPYIPKLEGVYKQRFYDLVSSWRHGDTREMHVDSIEKEVKYIAQTSLTKTEQYNRYRAVLLLLRDLLTTTWAANFEYGQLMLNTFIASGIQGPKGAANIKATKEQLQRCMESSRCRVLEDNRDFIVKVEQGCWQKQKVPISALITDGKLLVQKLREVLDGKLDLHEVIDPELQLVDSSFDETTGLRLLDIWRYFRYTWSSPAENTPGRSMQYLVRNKALSGHPIMGISSLDNCALAMGPRDEYLGWTADAFVRKLVDKGFSPAEILTQINTYLSDGISSIDTRGFWLTAQRKDNPTADFIAKLRSSAQSEKDKRRESLAEDEFKANSEFSKKLLFRKKRGEKLASLLDAKRQINEFIDGKGGYQNLTFDDFSAIQPAITVALQAQKEKHIGSSLLELNVCGAIPPYNELLVGKLVALTALTPYVIDTYREKYRNRPSEIASQMLGEDVIRNPDLVYVGTTSLYSVGSSQYNRLVVPKGSISSSFDLRYVELGKRTQGFGTFHISRQTTEAIEIVLEKSGSQTVNHQFGEGASPKLRLLGEGVRTLLKSDSNSSVGAFTTHSMPRIIYAAPLISNLFEYLLGIEKKPKYYESRACGKKGTRQIINFWMERWLRQRLKYAPAIERIANFNLDDEKNRHLVGQFLGKETEGKMNTEGESEFALEKQTERLTGPERIQFLRRFYKNGSSYSDSTNLDVLKAMHIKTKLDESILNTIRQGKDCVLTGNPGDGKTHILRVLREEILEINDRIEPIYDASTLTTEEIAKKWMEAYENKIPFLIAINASILDELVHLSSEKVPPVVAEAYQQFESAITDREIPGFENHTVVVFNLGLRSALDSSVVSGVIEQMTDSNNFKECNKCPFHDECGFKKHAEIIRSSRFRERIQKIFERVELVGQHITIRDVQAFFSYLVFWNHPCKNVVSDSECDRYRIENLIYEEGRGNLFKAIRSVFDPALISMPELDEQLVIGNFSNDAWIPGTAEPQSAVDDTSLADFNRRKRSFYFFHESGNCLLENRKRNSVAGFEEFLNLNEKRQLKEILTRLRCFIGDRETMRETNDTFPVWRGFRFDNSSRRIILSVGSVPRCDFSIVKPHLLPSMQEGISTPINYVLLREVRSHRSIKIDFGMFKLLEYSEQKVPVWALEENNYAKKIWRFMEDLDSCRDSDDDDKQITLYDLKRKEKISVEVDTAENRYMRIHKG